MKNITIIFSLLLTLAACGGAGERKAAYMERAHAYEAEANYEKARVEYQNALQIDPKDIPARFGLAQTLEHLNEWQNAAGHYQYIVNEDAQHTGARYRLGRIYLAARNIDKALELAEDALRVAPGDVDAMTLRGAALAKKGDMVRAKQDGLAVLEKDPGHKEAVALVASLYMNDKDSDKAIALLQDGIKRNPDDASLQILLGSIFINQNDSDRGIEVFKKIVTLDPSNLGHRARLAALMIKLGRMGDAETVLRQGVNDNPENVQAKLVLVDFLAKQMGKDKAEKQLQEYIQSESENDSLRNGLASLYLSTGEVDKAKQTFRDMIDKNISDTVSNDAKVKLAEIALRQNDTATAEKLLEEVLTLNVRHNDALMLRGAIYLSKREATKAIADFRAVLRDQPNVPKVYQQLASAHLQNQEYEQAVDNMQRAVELETGNTALREKFATMLVQLDRADQAIEQYRILAKGEQDTDRYNGALFQLLIKKDDRAGAQQLTEEIAKAQPESYLAYYLQGALAQMNSDIAGSRTLLQKALTKAPDNVEVISALVKSFLLQKQFADTHKLLDEKLSLVADKAAIHNIKGEVLLLEQKPEQAVSEFSNALTLKKDWVKPYQNLAAVYFIQKKTDQVVATYERGLKATNNDASLVISLATFYEKTGKFDHAIATYEKHLTSVPNSAPLANNLAMLLVNHKSDKKSLDQALQLIEPLARLQEPAFQDTVGWVLYKNEKYERAVLTLEQAVKAEPEATIFNFHLGMAYLAQGNKEKAKPLLQKAVDEKADYFGKQEAAAALTGL